MVGETATITCAFALKVTSIKWLLKDDIVREDTSGQQQLNLTFSPVNDSIHNLQYICRVTTNGTEYDYPVTVTVEGVLLISIITYSTTFTPIDKSAIISIIAHFLSSL